MPEPPNDFDDVAVRRAAIDDVDPAKRLAGTFDDKPTVGKVAATRGYDNDAGFFAPAVSFGSADSFNQVSGHVVGSLCCVASLHPR